MKMTKKVKTNEPGVNTLVRHKKLTTLGIGCISKVHPKHYTVNWGLNDSNKCLKTAVEEVDTSKCATVTLHTFQSRILSDKGIDFAILGNEVKQFVGIGWISLRVVTEKDLLKIPRVVDNGD